MSESLDASVFRRRRERYMDQIGDRGVAVICSPPEAIRNGDVHHPFRQTSDLLYLTGFVEPETTLVLRPEAKQAVVLFVRPRDPERETWDGRRAGVAGAVADYGADVAYPMAELNERLPSLLANRDDLYYSVGVDADADRLITATVGQLRARARRGEKPPRRIVDPAGVLHEMRLHKTDEELAIMRRAAAITAEAHIEAMRTAAGGVGEYELEALVNYTFRRRGGSGPGYSTIVGSADNATILHYTENDRVVRDGELILIDAGCEVTGYTADVTRTFPVNGTFSDAQRRVYEVVLAAETAGIEMTRPGVTIGDIHKRCVQVLTAGMVELGLLKGPVADRISDESYKRFYMHRTSHWLGMDVHDVGAYLDGDASRPLEPGMVLTIEPGLYIAAGSKGVDAAMLGIGVRIEDDVLVTADGCSVLTEAVPRTVEDVERTCRGQ